MKYDKNHKWNSIESFKMGYEYGLMPLSRDITNREIEIFFPNVCVESFSNGLTDGLKRDNFRYNLICNP
jgi:hypothetical protein